jgi:hypothetical protein
MSPDILRVPGSLDVILCPPRFLEQQNSIAADQITAKTPRRRAARGWNSGLPSSRRTFAVERLPGRVPRLDELPVTRMFERLVECRFPGLADHPSNGSFGANCVVGVTRNRGSAEAGRGSSPVSRADGRCLTTSRDFKRSTL